MSALQGIPGLPGDTGLHHWSRRGIPPGVEILLPEDSGGGPSGSNWARRGETTEPSPTVFGYSGGFGRAGSTFVPDVLRASQPHRLSGPIQFVPKLLEFWCLEEEDAGRLLGFGVEEADYVASALAGMERFHGRDVRERIAHLFWIRKTLSAWFRDRDTENAWLREAHSWLDDRAPMDLLLGGSMEDLLLVRDYVDTAAGV